MRGCYLQVHDELLLEVPEAEVDTAKTLVENTMRNAYQLDVPAPRFKGASAKLVSAEVNLPHSRNPPAPNCVNHATECLLTTPMLDLCCPSQPVSLD